MIRCNDRIPAGSPFVRRQGRGRESEFARAPGELYSLLGHNGAGKTTAIKMLVGLIRPSRGTIQVGGYDLVTHTRDATALIGYVPDQPYLYDKLSGREILQFVARMYGMDGRQQDRAMQREIERFELAEFVDQLTETYSHGMKQRTVFASALLHMPRVLVVDEPMVGLDPHSIRLVKDLLQREVAAGMCVLMSTHTLGGGGGDFHSSRHHEPWSADVRWNDRRVARAVYRRK